MPLSQAQQGMLQKARALGGGGQGVALTDGMCLYIVARIVADLGVSGRFPELPRDVPELFSADASTALQVRGSSFLTLFERLVSNVPDADLYFSCLAKLHKTRMKYDRILQTQPFPTMEQVGPGRYLNMASSDRFRWRHSWLGASGFLTLTIELRRKRATYSNPSSPVPLVGHRPVLEVARSGDTDLRPKDARWTAFGMTVPTSLS